MSKQSFYYWGRRGPSGHLTYKTSNVSNVSYYYNEVVVPIGYDKIGSYFQANGFDQGYFGIQVNSASERRVLFSVWSEYDPENPIPNVNPNDYTVVLLKKGADVYDGQFGGEGAGGQSYLKFNWTAGTTYKFLTKAQPESDNSTTFTSWFFDPVVAEGNATTNAGWRLIASFKKPRISTYLNGFYSFV